MTRHITSRTWLPEQIEVLRKLVETGASPIKAAARLKRSAVSIQMKAKETGVPFPDRRHVKRKQKLREAEARKALGLDL